MQSAECVLVPGGFGDRGVSGMVLAAKYARENKVPYLGICLGMQIAVIEFARSVRNLICFISLPKTNFSSLLLSLSWHWFQVLGLERANSTEFDAQTPDPVVIFMPEVCIVPKQDNLSTRSVHSLNSFFTLPQGSRTHMGSTMRLGSRRTHLESRDSLTSKL